MLKDLQNSLQVAQSNHMMQQQNLQELFLYFHETYLKMSYKQNPFVPSQNLFNKVRVEVLGQIFVFLDVKSLLKFRFVNKNCNEKLKQIIPYYIIQLHKIIQQQEQQIQFLQTKIDSNQENAKIQNLQNQANGLINTINQQDLNEINAMKKPIPLMMDIYKFLEILLQDKNVKLTKGFQITQLPNLKDQLYQLNVQKINQKQLEKLQSIHSINPQLVQNVSSVLHILYQVVILFIELRETDLYINKSSVYEFEKTIEKIEGQIIFLKKFSSD